MFHTMQALNMLVLCGTFISCNFLCSSFLTKTFLILAVGRRWGLIFCSSAVFSTFLHFVSGQSISVCTESGKRAVAPSLGRGVLLEHHC